jgi:hypothetical protein
MISNNRKKLLMLAESLLFEHSINEWSRSDYNGRKFPNYTMYDRPADKIDGNNHYEPSYEEKFELPLAPSDIMSDHITTLTVSHEELSDKNYVPKNNIELMRAINSIMKSKDMTQKQIEKIWNINKKILSKV